MTCKDCIHDCVCPTWNYHTDDFAERDPKTCGSCKPRSRFIELLGAVGDTVYRVGYAKVYDWWKIERIEIYADEIVYIDNRGNTFTNRDIGKIIFLNKEEAEKVFAERFGRK